MLSTIDLAVIGVYAVAIFVLAQWVAREKPGHEKDSNDYFLASKALPEPQAPSLSIAGHTCAAIACPFRTLRNQDLLTCGRAAVEQIGSLLLDRQVVGMRPTKPERSCPSDLAVIGPNDLER